MHLFSNNGTKLVEANRELKMLINMLKKDVEFLSNDLSQDGITWPLIPPRSAHFEDFGNPVSNRPNIIFKGFLGKSD